jgi:hypothetical protein
MTLSSLSLVSASNIWFDRSKPEDGDRSCIRIPVVCQIHTMVKVQKFNEFKRKSCDITVSFNNPLPVHKAASLKITLQEIAGQSI